MTLVGFGQQLPQLEKPELPGYVTSELCAVRVESAQAFGRSRGMVVGAVAGSVVTGVAVFLLATLVGGRRRR